MNWEFIKVMEKIYLVLDHLEEQLIERDYPIIWEKVHATSCAQIGRLLAEKRGVDMEQAAIACALHDFGRWISGRQTDHAPKGKESTQRFLEELNLKVETIDEIVHAVVNHSKKEQQGTPLEEIVKDADILDCYWYGQTMWKPHYKIRLENALRDVGIQSIKEC